MAAELSTTGKAKLDREGLEKQGVFIFDGPPLLGDIIPEFGPDGEINPTLFRARAHVCGTNRGRNMANLCARIPNHVSWLRELLLDCTGIIPSYSLEELRPEESAEIPGAAIFDDEIHLNRSRQEKKMAREEWRKVFCESRQAARKACDNMDSNVAEDVWQHFMNVHIFRRDHEGRSSLLDA